MTSSIFLVETVVVLGWLMASVLGTWAYFAGEQNRSTN